MHLRWLLDFIAVAELGSFSKAAESRAITQPAISRHIKQLEQWVGVPLLSREQYPVTLTSAGRQFFKLAGSTVEDLERGKSLIQAEYNQQQSRIKFVMQHVLAAEFFTTWWSKKSIDQGSFKLKVDARNLPYCVQQLENKQSDFLICYSHSSVPLYLDSEQYIGRKIGSETMQAVSALRKGKALFSAKQLGQSSLPLVSSGPEDFMGRIVSGIINRNNAGEYFNRIYEDSFSEGVRAHVLAGFGVGWLPASLVAEDIQNKRLIGLGNQQWQEQLDIMLYCRQNLDHPLLDAIWSD
jgi:DNA-binding transcriptional LysR family regulator